MKKSTIVIIVIVLICLLHSCFGDSGSSSNLGNYDYNHNGSIEDREFQDATKDFMDSHGY